MKLLKWMPLGAALFAWVGVVLVALSASSAHDGTRAEPRRR